MSEIQSGEREQPSFGEKDYAPLEYLIYGSTPDVNGVQIVVNDLITRVQQGDLEARRRLLTPLLIQEGKKNIRNVGIDRQIERDAIRKVGAGMFPIFETKGQLDLDDESLAPWFEPAALDEQTGMIIPEWRIHVVKNKEIIVPNPEMFGKLVVRESQRRIFSLEAQHSDQPFRRLVAKL